MKRYTLKICWLVLLIFVSLSTGFAQQFTLNGTVSDNIGQPLPGATVQVKSKSIGTITDNAGKFQLNVALNEVLVVSYIGYESKEITVLDKNKLIIVLNENTKNLDEVVIVGFGSQKKINLTGAVGVIDSKALETRPVRNVTEALQGLVGGLNIYNESGGGLGSTPSINIRGITTIGQGSVGNPLVLVDGIEVNLSTINPQDIESISVLKDAAASSIYGSRAPFGVVLITTKKAKKGKPIISYTNNFRFSSAISTPRMADSYSFVLSMNTASRNAGSAEFFSPDIVNRVKQYIDGEITTPTIAYPDNPNLWAVGYRGGNDNINYYDVIYKETVPSQEHNISLSGSSDKISYYISTNYLQQNGLFNYGSDHSERYSTNGKIDATLNNYLKIRYNVRFSRNDLNQPAHMGGLFYSDLARQIWPTKPLYDNNGILFDDHVLGLLNGGKEIIQIDNLIQNMQIEIEPIKGWKILGNLNYKIENQFQHMDRLTYYQTAVDGFSHGNEWRYSTVTEHDVKNNYYNLDLHSDYEKTFSNGHYFKIMSGVQSEGNNYRNLYVSRDGIIDPSVPTINTTTGLGFDGKVAIPAVSGGYSDWAVFGVFGRLNYNYNERYLLEANLRYDGSSRFRANNRWGIFPSFSAGWNAAKEDFFKPLSTLVSVLKIRASYGSLGNQNTNNLYPTYEIMGLGRSSGSWLINGTKPNYAWMPSLIDQDLTWEKVNSWNAGVDISLLNNRLNSSFDYFTRFTKDMVGPAEEVPASLGIAVPFSNNTDLKTWGFEFELSWKDKLANGFRYGAKFILSDTQTQILRYPNPTNTRNQYREGQMMGEIWGYTTKGIAKTDEEMQDHLLSLSNGGQDMMGKNWKAGDIMYVDVDGNGRIDWGDWTSDNPGDMKIIGSNAPRFSYGFDLSADYKGLDFRVFLQGVMKRDFYQDSYYFWGMHNSGPWGSTLFVEHKDYFRSDPNDPLGQNIDGYYPRPLFGTAKNQQSQTRFLQDASYLRLKNVQIGYSLSSKLLEILSIKNVRFYFSGENLLTITKLTRIFDPETVGGGLGGSTYPLSKAFSFGMTLTL